MSKKKIRIFAGPNGSGKSTIFKEIAEKFKCGCFVNADEIEVKLKTDAGFNFSDYNLTISEEQLLAEMETSSFGARIDIESLIGKFSIIGNTLLISKQEDFIESSLYSYFAAFIADFCRNELLAHNNTFTMETVMSHPSKLDFIKKALEKGFCVYLYFITTKDVLINQERVKDRVVHGGHHVSEEKIKSRYYKSLDLLFDAIKLCHNSYIIDTSEKNRIVIAEIRNAELKIVQDTVPSWFVTYVLNKLTDKNEE